MDQLPLFNQKTMREKLKVPLDESLVRKGKAAYDKGDMHQAAEIMREIRYKLEAKCNSIRNG